MNASDFGRFRAQLLNRLLIWSGLSVAAGLFLQTLRDPFGLGLGQQFAAWGLVDGLIALLGLGIGRRKTRPAAQQLSPDQSLAQVEQEAQKLQRLLLVNSALDLFYIFGGLQLVRRRGIKHPYWRGAGLGVLIQGAFLFFFDLLNAARLSAQRKHRLP